MKRFEWDAAWSFRRGAPAADDEPDAHGRRRCAQEQGRHGAVVVAEDVETCFTTAIWLEDNAKKQLWASVLGTPRPFSPEVVERVRTSLWQRQILLKTWDHYVAKGRREGIL